MGTESVGEKCNCMEVNLDKNVSCQLVCNNEMLLFTDNGSREKMLDVVLWILTYIYLIYIYII